MTNLTDSIQESDYLDRHNKGKKNWAKNCEIIQEMETNQDLRKIVCNYCEKRYCHDIHVEDEYNSISKCPYCGRKNLISV